MFRLWPDRQVQAKRIKIGHIPALVVKPKKPCAEAPGVHAEVDVYHTDMHAFDMLRPGDEISKQAIRKFEEIVGSIL